MIGEVQYMRKGQIYRIKNRKTQKFLTSGLQINATPIIKGKISQLWLLDQVKPTQYEIVSLQSGQVMTRNVKLNLEKGKWKQTQFWQLQRAQLNKNLSYFWLTANDNENMYLFGSGASDKVHMKSFDKTLFVSNWQIQQIDEKQDFGGCCSINSVLSTFALDVPQASTKDGTAVIQYTFNGRGNQRWILQKMGNEFVLRNLCSSLVLAPHKKDKLGTKVIQTTFQNIPQQKWTFEIVKNNIVKIKTASQPNYYLGASSNKEGASIILTNQQDKIQWQINGYVPQILPQ